MLIIFLLLMTAVTNVAMLMGCDSKELMVVLSTCKLQAGRDCIAKRLTLPQATDMRDSLAKIIYASLFNWLVEQINTSLEVGKLRTGRSISILDIYGFESFKVRNLALDLLVFYFILTV